MKGIREIIKEWKRGELPGICLISTDDKGLLNFLIETFKSAVSSKHKNFEVIRYESPASAIESARSFSLLLKPRIIICEIKEKEVEILKNKPEIAGNTYLVFSTNYIPLKELLNIKEIPVLSIKGVYEEDMKEIIKEYLSLSGYKITEEGVDTILSYCGGNFGEIMNEIEKLMNYAGDKKTIEEGDVLKVIAGTSKEVSPEEIFRAIMMGNKREIFRFTHYLKNQAKRNPNLWMLFIGYINSRLRTLLEIKEKMKTEKVKVEPFLQILARRLKYQKIYQIFDILREYDIRIKFGYLPRDLLFEGLVLEIFSALGYL